MTLYHVTHTDRVESIRKGGLRRFRKSNWIKAGDGERYGDGEIFAFEHLHDALRWAGKMDWEFNRATGTGRVSIVTFDGDGAWEADEADPLSQAESIPIYPYSNTGEPNSMFNPVPITAAWGST